MKILVEGKKQEDMMYRVQCPFCHGIFEGAAKELIDPNDAIRGYPSSLRVRCPCCQNKFRGFEPNCKISDPSIIRCIDTSLDDFENPKKQGLQKKGDI